MIFGMKIGAFFNSKLKKGVKGRKENLKIIKEKFSKSDKVIWMHSASLGEYEQGLPVLEQLKKQFPQYKILITFFSPSGYENVINKNHIADAICYLPFDRKSSVKQFVSQFHTEIFFTIKYDYWYQLLNILKKNDTKIYVVSALFYPKQMFFKFYGKWFVNQLKNNVDWFFHQTEISCSLAKTIGLKQSSITGDTRFDRVKQNQKRFTEIDFINEFKQDEKLILFGSSWEAEEKIAELVQNRNKEVKIIIAPHDLKRISSLQKLFPEALLYSNFQSQTPNPKSQILLIDSIGLLSRLYHYADIAVVGGGFHSAGLHNILEAATFGVPVLFGNQYRKNPEADALISAKGGQSFNSEKEVAHFILDLIQDENRLQNMKNQAYDFVQSQPNSAELILSKIIKEIK